MFQMTISKTKCEIINNFVAQINSQNKRYRSEENGEYRRGNWIKKNKRKIQKIQIS